MNAPKAPRNQGQSPPDNGVIDLTDPIPSPFEDDAPIIELTDRVNTADGDLAGLPPVQAPATAPLARQPEEAPLDLEDERIPIDLLDDAIILDEAEDPTGRTDDFVDSLGLEIPPAADPTAQSAPLDRQPAIGDRQDLPAHEPDLETRVASALPPERIEAVLERVIEKIYAEKIEGILVETVERVVKREIEEIRSTLLGDGEA